MLGPDRIAKTGLGQRQRLGRLKETPRRKKRNMLAGVQSLETSTDYPLVRPATRERKLV